VEAAPDALCVHPDLPFTSSAVPRRARVVPPVQSQRVVEPEEGVTLHRQAEVAAARTVGHPQVDGTGLMRHCDITGISSYINVC
jgi:hypothetical protein